MFRSLWARLIRKHRVAPGLTLRRRWRPQLEELNHRITPAVAANFNPNTGVLSIVGTAAADQITVSRDTLGRIFVRDQDGRVDVIAQPQAQGFRLGGNVATVDNVTRIDIDGLGGDDTITIDQSNGNFSSRNGPDFAFGEAAKQQQEPRDIDFDVDGGTGMDHLRILGRIRASDRITFGALGINLRGNDDVDVTVAGLELYSVHGQGGNDTLSAAGSTATGAAFGQVVRFFGDGGNDVLIGGNGHDTLDGGSGNDTLTGGAGNDTMIGGAGTDELRESGDVNFTLTDTSLTGAGNDSLSGFERATLLGGAGANNFDASAFTGLVTLRGRGGDDTLVGGDNGSVLYGGTGNDSLVGGIDADTIRGQEGDDDIDGGGGDDTLLGGDGNDTIEGGAGNDRIRGGENDDVLSGGDDDDDIQGGPGNDSLAGGDGDDTLAGGLGDDTLSGDDGNDVLNGDDGNDELDGGDGNDLVSGGNGNDSLTGGDGDDTLQGDSGTDTLIETGNVNFTLGDFNLTGLGNDALLSLENAFLTGGASGNVIDASAYTGNLTALGEGGNDTITGGSGNDSIDGGAGDDTLIGGDGDDTINGNADDDDIDGGLGTDVVNGGAGTDTCVNAETATDCEA